MAQIADRLPLSRYRVFESSFPDEVEVFLARKRIDFRVGGARPGSSLKSWINGAYLPNMYLSALAYDGFVEIAAPPDRGDYAVQIPLASTFGVQTGNLFEPIGRGQAAVGSPGRKQIIRSTPECARLAISIGRDAMVKQLSALIGDAIDEPLVFAPVMVLDDPQVSSLAGLVSWAVAELERSPSLLHNRLAATQFEQFLITTLLLAQESNYRRRLDVPNGSDVCVRGVKRAIDYIEANADVPITLSDLVAISGTAGRTLYKHFRLSKGTSPMAYMRRVRLQRVREELLHNYDAKTVTEIATRWGFIHLGRFSAEYHRCFGETPSNTLRRRH
jgi:AraC-like DNA-binding protein